MSNTQSAKLTDFSLEMTSRDIGSIPQVAASISNNTQVKIAYLGNETMKQRLDAIEALNKHSLEPMPIISARRITSPAELESYLSQAKKVAAIESLFLVGGDPSAPQGPFSDSLELIQSHCIEKFAIKNIGIAGYPVGHPKVHNDILWAYLKQKHSELVARGFSVEITTQLSFDAEGVINWIEQVRQANIDAPIRIGVPSPTTLTGLMKFAKQCRVSTSLGLLLQYGWKVSSLLGNIGPESFLEIIQERLQQLDLGDVRLHIYPIGNLVNAVKWANKNL
ncbi:methylenetetrahydrofolate reductase [Pelagibaculum spongiae]|nr:methylenetetrahydrofolate reductase [Pelagibaculum spongiae]